MLLPKSDARILLEGRRSETLSEAEGEGPYPVARIGRLPKIAVTVTAIRSFNFGKYQILATLTISNSQGSSAVLKH
jgi:hypothetical protein